MAYDFRQICPRCAREGRSATPPSFYWRGFRGDGTPAMYCGTCHGTVYTFEFPLSPLLAAVLAIPSGAVEAHGPGRSVALYAESSG